jgi:hypothetical protein
VSVLRNTGGGAFASAQNHSLGTTPTGMTLGDLDGDGRIDLIVGNQNAGTVTVFENQSAP